ncbi:MAG: VWA domain-containing protein [Chloroflexi bacterium]|nr:VWA domain-containing protein [Chloroflexota bacterium]
MSYEAQITRLNPTCILFILDQSGSMDDPFGGQTGSQSSKAQHLATAVNRLLYDLVLECVKRQEEGPRNYYQVGLIGYGSNNVNVGSAFVGSLAGQDLVWVRDLANNPARVEDRFQKVDDGAGGLVDVSIKFPIWVDPVAENGTPMEEALHKAYTILEPWVRSHPHSYPPLVIHITDGEPNPNTDPSKPAGDLRKLATDDGNVLVFNLHLSSQSSSPILYPESDTGLPDQYAKQLFQMSSVLPTTMQQAAGVFGYRIGSQSRGFVFNANNDSMIKFLRTGTIGGLQKLLR